MRGFYPTKLADTLLATALPYRCVLCGDPAVGMDLCHGCMDDLPWLDRCCARCAIPLQRGVHCPACAARRTPAWRCVAALLYEYPVDRLVAALKFRGHRELGRVLGELLAIRLLEFWRMNPDAPPDLLVPVPLHSDRLKERGYNQAELLARYAGAMLGIPVQPATLHRHRPTEPQSGLSRSRRFKNIRGAFRVAHDVSGTHIAVIDDVITTGATVTTAVNELRRAGAGRVEVWAVARRAL